MRRLVCVPLAVLLVAIALTMAAPVAPDDAGPGLLSTSTP